MKTLTELARELRTNTGDFGATMDEAADRIEEIDKTWDAFIVNEGVSWKISPTGCMTFGDLRRAIEGRDS